MHSENARAVRLAQLTPWLIVAAAILAGINAMDALPVGVFYDDALYVILGKSLSLGQGYRYINLPGAPAATHYPPGYPALLALLWTASPKFPENIALFKLANALLLGVIALFTFKFAHQRLGATRSAAAFAAVASTVTIPALVLSTSVMSETLFLALLLPLLRRAEQTVESPGLRNAMLLGGCAALLFYFRAHALVLLPAIGAGYFVNRRRREALAALLVGAALLLPWIAWVRAHDSAIPAPLRGSYGSYGAWFADGLRADGFALIVSAARENLATIGAIVARSFSVARHGMLDALALIAVLVLCCAGAIDWARRARVTLVFVALYLAIVVTWPFSPLRFVWGIWPLVVLMMVSGARLLIRRDSSSRFGTQLRAAGGIAAAVALIGAIVFNARGYANAWWATVGRSVAPRIQPQLTWTATHASESAVVAVEDEGAVYLYTGRRAVPATSFTASQYVRERSTEANAANMAAIIRAFAPTFVIISAIPSLEAAALLTATHPPLLSRVDTISKPRVFRPNVR